MRIATSGCPKVAQRLQLEDDCSGAKELHTAEAGRTSDNYNKTDKQNEGPIVSATRLATVTIHKWMGMLTAWFRGNSDAQQSQEPNPPRRWPCLCVSWLLLLPVLSLALVGSTWLGALTRPSASQNDEVSILLHKYGRHISKTKFGDALAPMSSEEMHNPLGPDVFKLKRAVRMLNCSDFNGPNTTTTTTATKKGMMPTPPHASSNQRRTSIADFNFEYFEECPAYFNWLREDLAPWKESGISRISLELAKKHAAFRATILKGQLYIDLYTACYQTRLLFTIWGLLLLLEKYKTTIPDVEFMFNCYDRPRAKTSSDMAIPLFSYCSNRDYYDIPWPDWSFWGWPELLIESWDQEFDEIRKGSKQKDWTAKHKKAVWRGNPYVNYVEKTTSKVISFRKQLLFCHNTTENSNVDVMVQDWDRELLTGKRNSKLQEQCTHRYMVYVEGVSWSASLKYIMACGSPTLVASPNFYDFYQRGLQAGSHYIRLQPNASCISKFCPKLNEVVNNAESNLLRAETIGKIGQAFVQKEVSMDKVYDYMYHVLSKYADLQEFEPQISKSAHLVTQEYILCLAEPLPRLLLKQSRKHMASTTIPCAMSEDRARFFKDYGWESYKHVNSSC